jgi:hypothetical protein
MTQSSVLAAYFMPVCSLAYSLTLKMEVLCSFETSVDSNSAVTVVRASGASVAILRVHFRSSCVSELSVCKAQRSFFVLLCGTFATKCISPPVRVLR